MLLYRHALQMADSPVRPCTLQPELGHLARLPQSLDLLLEDVELVLLGYDVVIELAVSKDLAEKSPVVLGSSRLS